MARLSDKGLVRPTPNGAWVLTDAGRREVEDSPVTLPESPQQRRWREARELAEMHCEKMRQDLIAAIKTTVEMLNAREPVPAERWQACGHRLKLCCEAMAAVDFALNASNDPKDGPARGDTWITFWVRYGLIYRMPARRRNGVNGADRQGEDTPAVIDQVDLDELPEDTGAEAATSR